MNKLSNSCNLADVTIEEKNKIGYEQKAIILLVQRKSPDYQENSISQN